MQDSVLEHGCMLRMKFGKAAASIFVTYLRRGLITSILGSIHSKSPMAASKSNPKLGGTIEVRI
jgi:hypothetical protein